MIEFEDNYEGHEGYCPGCGEYVEDIFNCNCEESE